jgi:hypothetical protein
MRGETVTVRSCRMAILFIFLITVMFHESTSRGDGPRQLDVGGSAAVVETLPQNWTDADANWFYSVPQGSKLLPYAWFLHLEESQSTKPFRDNSHIRALGYLPRTPGGATNPDGLPVGFTKDGEHLGITCAACHTNQIQFQGRAWLIDGAPTLGDFDSLLRELVEALDATSVDAAKFERFSTAILGSSAVGSVKAALKQQLDEVRTFRRAYNARNLAPDVASRSGPGRIDAFGSILNEVVETFAKAPNNHARANAPVSYPFLWDTPHHDFVQWNGAAPNKESVLAIPLIGTRRVGALGRNVGEVLGVFGTVEAGPPGPKLGGYESSVEKRNLIEVEEVLRKLWSPQWPAGLGAISEDDRLAGKQLFQRHCVECHDDSFNRTAPDRHVEAKMRAVGTDPTMAANFATRRARTGLLEGRLITLPGLRAFGPDAAASDMLVHMVERVIIGGSILSNPVLAGINPEFVVHAELRLDKERRLQVDSTSLDLDSAGKVRAIGVRKGMKLLRNKKEFTHDEESFDHPGRFFSTDNQQLVFDLAGRAQTEIKSSVAGLHLRFDDAVPVSYQYKGRPLNGIWATAPYLHNGSVPNLDELLKPAVARVKKFKVGSREFDPVKVGFRSDSGSDGAEFDTTAPGNSNSGHEYDREFSPQERAQLIAYMKSL